MFHDEVSLRRDVIVKPIQFFVVPATLVVCKHVPTENDPTLHQLPIHLECMKKMRVQWQHFTTKGVLDHKLLLMLLCDHAPNVQTIINLMLKYGLLVKLQHDPASSISDPPLLSYIVPPLLPDIKPSLTCQHSSSFYFVFTTSNYLEGNFTFITNSDLETHGFLPHGLFERIIGKCVSWSQRTSKNNTLQNCALGHSSAILTFGSFRFQLKLMLELSSIEVKIEGNQPRAVMKRLCEIINDIIKERMNMLQYFTAVSFVRHGESSLIPLSSLNSAFERQSVMRNDNGDTIITPDQVHSQYHQWLDLKVQHEEWHVFLSYR